MRNRVIEQICYAAGVNVGEAEESPRKICGVVIGPENATKLLVEDAFRAGSGRENQSLKNALGSKPN